MTVSSQGGKEEETKLLVCLTYDKVQNFLGRIIQAECGDMF